MRRLTLLLTALAVLAAAATAAAMPGSQASRPRQLARASVGTPCGALHGHAPHVTHVLLLMMENSSYGEIIGNGRLPTINALARACGLATDYHAVTHPSLPNYIALTSGTVPASVAGRDCEPAPGCNVRAASIFGQTKGSWRVWAESMPSACSRVSSGTYAVRHTAAPYYPALAYGCPARQLRLGDSSRGLAAALASGSLPRFGLIVPNLIDDMHNHCRTCGDAFIAGWLPKITRSAAYRSGSLALVIVWDESDGSATNHVPLLVVSPYTARGARFSLRRTHYALLRAIESTVGLPLIGAATTAGGGLAHGFGLR